VSAEVKCPDCVDGVRMVLHKGTGERHPMRCACQVTDLPVRLVYQPESCGCVLAAVATIVGKSYRDVRHRVGMDHDYTKQGSHMGIAYELLAEFGYAIQLRYRNNQRLNAPREEWPCSPWADLHIAEVRNLADTTMHAVVVLRDGRVLDPWWGVVDGLHRYPRVLNIAGVFRVAPAEAAS